jgi:hypothetical protein
MNDVRLTVKVSQFLEGEKCIHQSASCNEVCRRHCSNDVVCWMGTYPQISDVML